MQFAIDVNGAVCKRDVEFRMLGHMKRFDHSERLNGSQEWSHALCFGPKLMPSVPSASAAISWPAWRVWGSGPSGRNDLPQEWDFSHGPAFGPDSDSYLDFTPSPTFNSHSATCPSSNLNKAGGEY
ncbi:hypothetical protein EVAR_78868_1 [Eumeta japonica]|uniref:Uncharacterized protein n=1 Tax=Eumeta variegata TaxID=151549 RepID=A0A4C1U2F0_EUMVA|nr:hypothetical protein EVAR_78868_1 [Eumeta japonica]